MWGEYWTGVVKNDCESASSLKGRVNKWNRLMQQVENFKFLNQQVGSIGTTSGNLGINKCNLLKSTSGG